MKIAAKHKLIAVVVLTIGVLAILSLRSSGPSYGGRSIDKWFYDASRHDVEAFRAMGPDAIPFLVKRLDEAPSQRIQQFLGRFSRTPKEIYRQRKEMWQQRAAYLLGEIGPVAISATPNLTNAAARANWAIRGAVTVALLKIHQQPVEPLIKKLNDTSDGQAWYEHAIMVGQLGARGEPAVPILLRALQHSNNVIQAHALIALGMIGKAPQQCVPAIVPFVTSPNVGDRQKAIGALLAFGTNALPAKQAIQGALSDSDPWVRSEAELALKALE